MAGEKQIQKQPTSDLQDVHHSMLNGLSALAEYFGLKSVAGRIYGILLLSNRPLSLDEISERLEISKSNISINIRVLENLRIVHRAFPIGAEYENRRNYYQIETDLQLVATQLTKRKLVELERISAIVDQSITKFQSHQNSLEGQNGQDIEIIIERANLIHTFLIMLQSFIQHMQELIVDHEIE
jgi:DNA-binding transcriptional regulator GbsR (MarR family)